VPRVRIEHTSEREAGQIYIPAVNWALMACCIALVVGFQSSSRLTAAYGVAVTTTMVITTLLFFFVERELWRWSLPLSLAVAGFFLVIDLGFWGANIIKIPAGGWFPLVVGAVVFTLLTTWKKGRRILAVRLEEQTLPRELFLKGLETNPPARVPGTAVFMYSNPEGTPPALLHSLKHYRVLHQTLVFLSVETGEVPYMEVDERAQVKKLAEGVYQVILSYGFMEEIDVPQALGQLTAEGLAFKPMETSYFLGRETLIASRRRGMALWRERLFALMARNAGSAGTFFRLPPNRVVELGAQIEL
jgi:KUP system potassium uptake protein